MEQIKWKERANIISAKNAYSICLLFMRLPDSNYGSNTILYVSDCGFSQRN